MRKKRVAVLVDNHCLRDTRVIKSAEAIAAKGYEVRVFCRDKRLPVGDSKLNGVQYQRNWVKTLYYAQNLKSQWTSLKLFLFQMPGGMFSKLTFCFTAFLLSVAYSMKYVIDYILKWRKSNRKFRNQAAKVLQKNRNLRLKRLRKANRKFLQISWRLYYKSSQAFEKIRRYLSLSVASLLALIILIIPLTILGFLVGLALLYIMINRWIQSLGQPGLNVAQKKSDPYLREIKNKNKKKRFHARLLAILLNDKSDETYVSRIVKYRAARIYVSVRDSVAKYKPDLIHAHDLVNLPVGVFLARDIDAKLIYDAHELEVARDKPSHRRWKKEIRKLEGYFVKQADALITVSHGYAEIHTQIHMVEQPTIIYNTPDVINSKPVKVNIRQEIGITNDTPLALYVGGLKIARGLPFFLEAAVDIPDLHIVACGPRTVKAEESFRLVASELGIANRFHMVGPIEQSYLLDYIRSANFSIMPTQNIGLSYIEALPNKFFESILCGVPIMVGKEISGMAKLTEKYGLGTLVQQDDPRDIACEMRKLLAQSDNVRQHIESQRLAKKFGWNAQVSKLLALYTKLLSEKV